MQVREHERATARHRGGYRYQGGRQQAGARAYVEGQGGDKEGDDQGHAETVVDDGSDAIYNRDNSSLFILTPPRRAWPAR